MPRCFKKVIHVVGARPNYIKMAAIFQAWQHLALLPGQKTQIEPVLVDTQQHRDPVMSRLFLEELHLPAPNWYLATSGETHGEQTASIMIEFEQVLQHEKPAAVIVVGDVNSTLACALATKKCGYPLVHVEAGLRCFDRSMPEEINRIITDTLSDLLFTTEKSAQANLLQEGIASDKIHFIGNVMIDTLLRHKQQLTKGNSSRNHFCFPEQSPYGLITLHRPSNVDNPQILQGICQALVEVSQQLPLLFPVHPRTNHKLQQFDLHSLLKKGNIQLVPPLGYLAFLELCMHARLIFTDSGGLQEETTILQVPCLTLRENTERPITVEQGSNVLVGNSPQQIVRCFHEIWQQPKKVSQVPELWDGKAAHRFVSKTLEWLSQF